MTKTDKLVKKRNKLPSKHSSWWRRLEDILKTYFVFVFRRRLQDVFIKTNMFALVLHLQKTSSRRLHQDEYVRLSLTPSEDVFKTSSRRLGQDQYIHLDHMSSRRFQNVLPRRLQDVFKTSCKDIFQTFSRRTIKLICSS